MRTKTDAILVQKRAKMRGSGKTIIVSLLLLLLLIVSNCSATGAMPRFGGHFFRGCSEDENPSCIEFDFDVSDREDDIKDLTGYFDLSDFGEEEHLVLTEEYIVPHGNGYQFAGKILGLYGPLDKETGEIVMVAIDTDGNKATKSTDWHFRCSPMPENLGEVRAVPSPKDVDEPPHVRSRSFTPNADGVELMIIVCDDSPADELNICIDLRSLGVDGFTPFTPSQIEPIGNDGKCVRCTAQFPDWKPEYEDTILPSIGFAVIDASGNYLSGRFDDTTGDLTAKRAMDYLPSIDDTPVHEPTPEPTPEPTVTVVETTESDPVTESTESVETPGFIGCFVLVALFTAARYMKR